VIEEQSLRFKDDLVVYKRFLKVANFGKEISKIFSSVYVSKVQFE
jgi:hypothetical protein